MQEYIKWRNEQAYSVRLAEVNAVEATNKMTGAVTA